MCLNPNLSTTKKRKPGKKFSSSNSPGIWVGGRRRQREQQSHIFVFWLSQILSSLLSSPAAAAPAANLKIFWNWSHHHFSFESEPIFFCYKSHHRLYFKFVKAKISSPLFIKKCQHIFRWGVGWGRGVEDSWSTARTIGMKWIDERRRKTILIAMKMKE